ncbi:hypothetical protein SDC9_166207 [bioreactor metagenome]|uniref:Uncharacterized protein n=1 Tax=bioreactor metagenome TaxID=1076179 RepID=A0A645FYQ5_9ZZZZ
MNSSYHMIPLVVQNNRNTIGCGGTQKNIFFNSYSCIHTIQSLNGYSMIKIEKSLIYRQYLGPMRLVRNDKPAYIHIEHTGKYCTIFTDIQRTVIRKIPHIEGRVRSVTHPTLTGSSKMNNILFPVEKIK